MYAKLVDVFDGYSRERFYSLSEPVRMGYTDVDKVFDAVEKARQADILQLSHNYAHQMVEDQYIRECNDILTNGVSLVCVDGPNQFQRREKCMMAAMRFWGWDDGKKVPCYRCLPYITLVYSYNRKSRFIMYDDSTSHDDIYLEVLAKVNGLKWEGIVE